MPQSITIILFTGYLCPRIYTALMELRQLKYFVKTAETLNFSEAARNLYITQSTLSQQIKTLEDELGVILFQRDSHNVTLTENGEKMLPLARQTLLDAETCKAQISDLNRLMTGTLNIGVTYSFSSILTETIKEFIEEYPGIKLNIMYRTMEELMDLLRKREADFVLAFKPNLPCDDIESRTLFEDKLSLIIRRDHPYANRQTVTIDDLSKIRLAIPAKGLQARNVLDKYVDLSQERSNISLELNEANILLDIVSRSNVATILSEATVRGRDSLKAVPLDVPNNQMQGCIHTLKKVYHKRSAEAFVALLRKSPAVMELSGKWL